jgi:hypothetical protein
MVAVCADLLNCASGSSLTSIYAALPAYLALAPTETKVVFTNVPENSYLSLPELPIYNISVACIDAL